MQQVTRLLSLVVVVGMFASEARAANPNTVKLTSVKSTQV